MRFTAFRSVRRCLRREMYFPERLLAFFGINMRLSLTYYAALVLLIVGSVTYAWMDLMFTQPKFLNVLCPRVTSRDFNFDRFLEIAPEQDQFQCKDFWENNRTIIGEAKKYKWCQRTDRIPDQEYLYLTRNCDSFRKLRKYNLNATKEENDFPLAFSIIMYENVEQAERLLRAIYRPHNFYCIHIDVAASNSVRNAMAAVAGCLDNVFISSRSVEVTWAMFSVLEAEIVCLHDLWRRKGWKYFINLTGREFPLKTNLELVRILKSYNGANDVDGTPHRRPPDWTMYVWNKPEWHTGRRKSPPPHGFLVHKGSTHVALTHRFVEYVLFNQSARDLLDWMKDTRTPDEMYFNTLSHNSQLGVPGAYIGDPELKLFHTRLKIWQSETAVCEGKWHRFICQLGVGDLHRLIGAKELFVNKLRIEFEPLAFECLEQWFNNRTRQGVGDDFDLKFYQDTRIAKHHVP